MTKENTKKPVLEGTLEDGTVIEFHTEEELVQYFMSEGATQEEALKQAKEAYAEAVAAEEGPVLEIVTDAGETLLFETEDDFAEYLISLGGKPKDSVKQAAEAFANLAASVAQPVVKEVEGFLYAATDGHTYKFENEDEFAQFLITKEGAKAGAAVKLAEETFAKLNVVPVAAPATTPVAAPAPAKAGAKDAEDKTKGWFKRAAEKMTLSSKSQLVARLFMEKVNAQTQEEKDEIQRFMDKLQNEAGFYKEKVEPGVAKVKGWTVDGTGKVADTLYLVGDYAGKGATGLTKVTGDLIVKTGEVISKTGELVKDNADNVGKVVEAPFKLTGDAINVLNGTKKTGDKKAEAVTETPATTPDAEAGK